jgi:endonuclease YncB( thermonuclease family)
MKTQPFLHIRAAVLGVLLALLLPAETLRSQQKLTGDWETLNGCRLATNAPVDGDSFHAVHEGRAYIFRLYFVDAPETDSAFTDRLQDQAAYFGIAPADIPRAGKAAAAFTPKTSGR